MKRPPGICLAKKWNKDKKIAFYFTVFVWIDGIRTYVGCRNTFYDALDLQKEWVIRNPNSSSVPPQLNGRKRGYIVQQH